MPKASWVHQDSFYRHKTAVRSGGQAGAVCLFWTLFFHVFQKAVHPVEMDGFYPCDSLFLSFIFNSKCWSVSMVRAFWDGCFPAKTQKILQRTLLHCSVDWPVHYREDCTWVLDGVLDITEHKMAHLHFVDYQCPSNNVLLFFYHVQKASQV